MARVADHETEAMRQQGHFGRPAFWTRDLRTTVKSGCWAEAGQRRQRAYA